MECVLTKAPPGEPEGLQWVSPLEAAVHAKILIVEDNPLNMELATDLLSTEGYQVLQATSVPAAREVLRASRPDLILLDIQLPGLDGLALARELQDDPRTGDIPIVALTAHAMKGDREKALQAGCRDYIAKPIDIETFLPAVARHVALPRSTGTGDRGGVYP